MSDLWRKCPECEGTGGWHGEGEFCDVCFGGGYLKVEPAMVYTVRESFGRTVLVADEVPESLAHGRYALIPLGVKSDD